MKPNDSPCSKPPRWKLQRNIVLVALVLCLVSGIAAIITLESGIVVHGGESLPAQALPTPMQREIPQSQPSRLASSPGRQAYLDPVTGKIGVPPSETTTPSRLMTLEEENALSTSSEGLVQVPLTGPAGGVKIDLQGRFRSQVVATIDTQSNLSVQCFQSAAGSDDSHQTNTAGSLHGASLNKGTQR